MVCSSVRANEIGGQRCAPARVLVPLVGCGLRTMARPSVPPAAAPPANLEGKFTCPLDLHIAAGRVYVADSGQSAVLVTAAA